MSRSTAVWILAASAVFIAPVAPAAAQDAGHFEARVNLAGASALALSGFAWSETNPAEGGWFAQLLTPGGGSSIVLLFAGDGRPPTGEYPIVDLVANEFEPPDGQFVATGSVDPQLFALTGFHSRGGTIVITASSRDAVEGTFEFQANGSQDGKAVTVEGTFTTRNKEE